MSSRAAFLWSEWVIFLDGIQVPHQGFQVSFPTNDLSRALIQLEPDARLSRLRPNTVVQIFARDRFPSDEITQEDEQKELGAKDKRELLLYWEGQSEGVSYAKSASSRVMTLRAQSLLGALDVTKAFMMGVGGLSYSPLITGSTLPIVNPGQLDQAGDVFGQDLLTMTTLSQRFSQEELESEEGVEYRESSSPSYAERLTRLVTYLTSFNAVLRQMVVRSRLLNKLVAVPDSTLDSFISIRIAQSLISNSQNQITASSSVLDIIRNISSYAYYKFIQVPMPNTPEDQPGQDKTFASLTLSDSADGSDQYKIPSEFYRNDILFVPELYYALPPPCNFIFPDMVRSFAIDRVYTTEPTRLVVTDPFLSALRQSYYFWLAPTSLLRTVPEDELSQLTSAEIFSMVSSYARSSSVSAVEADQSAYAYPTQGDSESDTVRSLLGTVLDTEFEKGIITSISNQGFEQFSALAYSRTNTNDSEGNAEVLESSTLLSDDNSDYRDYMLEIARYRLQLAKFRRQATASLVGHRWITPGFPTIIFDNNAPHLAHVDLVTLNVDPEGQETTDLQLSFARPVPKIDLSDLRKTLEEISSTLDDAETFPEVTIPSFESTEARLTSTLSDITLWMSLIRAGRVIELPSEAASNALLQQQASNLSLQAPPFSDLSSILLIYFGASQVDRVLALQEDVNKVIMSGREVLVAVESSGRTAPTDAVGGITYSYLQFLFSESNFFDTTDSLTQSSVRTLGPQFRPFSLLQDFTSVISGGSLSASNLSVSANSLEGVSTTLGLALDFVKLAQSALSSFLGAQRDTLSSRKLEEFITPPSFTNGAPVQDIATQTNERLLALVEEFETQYDWPTPPRFFNRQIIDPKSLDQIYSDLLGTQPFYRDAQELTDVTLIEEVSDRLVSVAGLSSEDKILYYLSYLQGLVLINSIFPVIDSSDPSLTAPGTENARRSWHQVSSDDGTGEGPLQWEHVNFLKRSATDLSTVLNQYGLELVPQYSAPPTVTQFWQLTPPESGTVSIGDRQWDNSIYSKLVDEREIRGLESDPLVREARETVRSNILTTTERQSELLKYSTAHFGGRGFDGS